MLESNLARFAVRARMRVRWATYNLVDRLVVPNRLACRICDHTGPTAGFREVRARDIFEGGVLVRHECPSCGVIFGTQRMLHLTSAELAREYVDVYRVYDEASTTEYELEAFRHLRPERGLKYLNYGAGKWSQAIERLRADGFDIIGFDRYEAKSAHVISDEAKLLGMRFDGIMTSSLMEHLVNPVEDLRLLRGLLRDGHSTMVHATPCFRYEVEYSRFHLFFFTGRSLDVIAEKLALKLEHTENPDVKRFVLR